LSCPKSSAPAVKPAQPFIHWVLGFFSGDKAAGAEVDHSFPSYAEVKNEWSCTSSPPVCLYGVHRDSFTFFTPEFRGSIFRLRGKDLNIQILEAASVSSSQHIT
jgi:hypothetical protein